MPSNYKKRIWITTDWEPNPLQEKSNHYGRMFSLSHYLSTHGYEVVLWFTTYIHPDKQYLYTEDTCIEVNDNEKIELLHSNICYKKNTSPTRFLYHSRLANRMKKKCKDELNYPKPDLIFCSYPPEQLCRFSIAYGKKNNVPVIVDARDQWPDIFERAFPSSLQKLANILLLPMKRRTAKVFREATALCAMSPVMLKWALDYADREKNELDKYVFIGSKNEQKIDSEFEKALIEWNELDISSETWNICLFTTLSKTAVDVDTVIQAVKIVHEQYPQIRLIIGGRGDEEERLKQLVKNIPYIHMMGWMNQIQMNSIMSISKVGMLCYRNTKDFKDGWGNKVGQYLSYGLPLFTSAEGFAKSYIEEHKCGIAYKEYDADGLAHEICDVIEEPEKYEMMAGQAKKCFTMEFDDTVVMEKFTDMINSVCNKYYEDKE